jgi:hypothetical protein
MKKAERDVMALEAELARYKGIVMEHRRKSMAAMVGLALFTRVILHR